MMLHELVADKDYCLTCNLAWPHNPEQAALAAAQQRIATLEQAGARAAVALAEIVRAAASVDTEDADPLQMLAHIELKAGHEDHMLRAALGADGDGGDGVGA